MIRKIINDQSVLPIHFGRKVLSDTKTNSMGMLLVRSKSSWGTRLFSLPLFVVIRYFYFTNFDCYPQYLFEII